MTASDAEEKDELGYSVAISGNTIVAGAPDKNKHGAGVEGIAAGAAYVFKEQSGNTEVEEITPTDFNEGDFFGLSVAVSGNTIAVGSPFHLGFQGAAYIFNEGVEVAELTASDGQIRDLFGQQVAISNGTLAVGAPGHPYAASKSGPGAAYAFNASSGTWKQTAEMIAPGGVNGDGIGSSVAVSGTTIVAGARTGRLVPPPCRGHCSSPHGFRHDLGIRSR